MVNIHGARLAHATSTVCANIFENLYSISFANYKDYLPGTTSVKYSNSGSVNNVAIAMNPMPNAISNEELSRPPR